MSNKLERHLGFSSAGRVLEQENEIHLVSVGVDIGSSTSHLIFSRIIMERLDNRYVVTDRKILYESEVLLTPYADDLTIDPVELGAFIKHQYELAKLTPQDIDTGALILTGVAVRRTNARAIGDLFSDQTGKFVAVSAGDALETILVAHGSGAIALSASDKIRVMNVDIGGGTSKIAICVDGKVVDTTVIDVGARIISFDDKECINRIENAGRRFINETGIEIELGDKPSPEILHQIVENMADRIFQAMGAKTLEDSTEGLLRLEPLKNPEQPDVVMFSGGVSEYLYGRDEINYGDLGPMLASAINSRIKAWGPELRTPAEGIRATVVGASQYTVQVSGNTIFVTPHETLPLRNIPVVSPDFSLDNEVLDAEMIEKSIKHALTRMELNQTNQTIAIYYHWNGSATFSRLDSFCKGVIQAMAPLLSQNIPLVLVSDGDVGGLIGIHCQETYKMESPIVSIDGIFLKTFDFIDIGALLETSGTVPVVIKSLVFPAADDLGRLGVSSV